MTASHASLSRDTLLLAGAREFYDPNRHFEDDQGLVDWLRLSRHNPVTVPFIGSVAAEDLVLVEMYHSGIADIRNPAPIDWLGIGSDTAEKLAESVRAHADHTARRAVDAIIPTRMYHPGLPKNLSEIVIASAVMAAKGHQDQFRLSGKPYFDHPKSVAIISEGCWREHLGEDDELHLSLHQSRDLLHDPFERSMEKDGSTFMHSRYPLITPLMLRLMLERLSVPKIFSVEVSQDMLALSKTQGPDGEMDYLKVYIPKRVAPRPGANPTKLGDIQHNVYLDPKPARFASREQAKEYFKKQAEYKQAQGLILDRLVNTAGIDIRLMQFGNMITKFDRQEMARFAPHASLKDLEPDKLTYAFDITK